MGRGLIYTLDYVAYATYFQLQGYSVPTPTTGYVMMDMGTRSN